ncbi:DUF924 family protein [Marinimicrobium locisalis]|uniref:DUF924 family protein n=1 Tax=Marinimicrobium locisalis TaxID=546022 RepID=UPI0032219CCF
MGKANEVLDFWFVECEPKHWFQKNKGFDREIERRFVDVYRRACACELAHWRARPEGRLAEVLVLDQFSRNLYRDRPEAFAQDALALALAQEAVAAEADQSLEPAQRAFLYMPYMHSESALIHEEAVRLFDQPGLEHNLKFERRHREIIERFGRYPHRNELLGRQSTEEEQAFLKQPGSSF